MSTSSLSSENKSSGAFGMAYEREVKAIKIKCQGDIRSVAFIPDGRHIVGGGDDGKIRRWRVEDGKEVGTPMDAQSPVYNIAVSHDGRWVVSGTKNGLITVWDAESHRGAVEFAGHGEAVNTVDVSPDGTRIATGSADDTVCVWSLSTGQRLLGPWKHAGALAAVKFSPDGHLIATATHARESIRVYDCQSDHLLVETPIKVYAQSNQLLAWESNNKILFSLSNDGYIHCLDLSTGKELSGWRIQGDTSPRCIVLSSNGRFIAASDGSLVSFWDYTTHKRIGYFVRHRANVYCMAISANFDLVTGGGKTFVICSLGGVLPSRYMGNLQIATPPATPDKGNSEEIVESPRAFITTLDRGPSDGRVSQLERTVQKLRVELASSNTKVAQLDKTNQQLFAELTDSRREAERLLQTLRVHERKQKCEALYAEGRISDALTSVFEISTTLSEEDRGDKVMMEWLSEFSRRCIKTLERGGGKTLNIEERDEVVVAS